LMWSTIPVLPPTNDPTRRRAIAAAL
jgi:hypothetical protein